MGEGVLEQKNIFGGWDFLLHVGGSFGKTLEAALVWGLHAQNLDAESLGLEGR